MSRQDREYANDDPTRGMGRPGGDWYGMRPTLDNPFTWAVTIGRVAGITVRVHLLLILFILIMLLRASLPQPQGQPGSASIGFTLMAIAMASLFVIVLAHEFGHCLACRLMGGQADEILMWPLGGLAYCRPRNVPGAHLVTAIGGPAVNVIVCVIAGAMLGLLTGKWLGVALPNPMTLRGLYEPQVQRSLAHQSLFLINTTSLILLLFNLMPVFPLDGGRIVQALLWPRYGYSRSMRLAVRTGYVGAIIMVVFGAAVSEWTLVAIGLFGAVTCYLTHKQLQWSSETLGFESDEYALSLHGAKEQDVAPMKPTRQERKAQRRALQEQKEAQEVDRILQKIAESGLESLTRAEKVLLERVTQRKRQQQQ
jgi:stage IV sporulation protein FB